MTASAEIRVRVVISGLVQGVFFRHYTRKNAVGFGLTGWVKNRPDGRVEAVFEGKESQVAMMLDWCHIGPPSARIADVAVFREEATGEFADFQILYD
ncbi:MAG: acylphosphatase [Syntrophaceae bacterium]|nr:acylphosphatase [Syntrophaceae bacterium]